MVQCEIEVDHNSVQASMKVAAIVPKQEEVAAYR